MRYPEVVGTRPPGTAFLHWYTKRFNQVATVDPDISLLFYRTINMLSPAAGLMKPGVFWKVLKGLPSPAPGAQASPSGAAR